MNTLEQIVADLRRGLSRYSYRDRIQVDLRLVELRALLDAVDERDRWRDRAVYLYKELEKLKD